MAKYYDEYDAWAKLKGSEPWTPKEGIIFKPGVWYRLYWEIGYSWPGMYYYPVLWNGIKQISPGHQFEELFVTKDRF